MSEIIIECPACNKAVRAGTSIFAKKKVKCSCGYVIDVNSERMTEDICPHCGNKVVYDRKKKASASCPVCHTRINAGTEMVKLTCPACKTELTADKNAKTYTCPQCKNVIDVQARLQQEKNSGKTSVIKWDMGMNDIFVYRHPVENFNIGSQLIVTEGQKALFFRNGKGLDVFGPGRHILETQKLPLLEEILKFPTDAELTFDSKVYFVRTNRLNVKWGVPEIRLRNPEMEFYINIGISGSMDVQVIEDNESLRKFVYMIIGASSGVDHNEPLGAGESYTTQYITEKFRDIVTTRLSDLMTNIIIENKINVLDIEGKKIVISDILRNDFNGILEEYGLIIPKNHFNLTTIKIHNNEDVERWRKQEAERSVKTREEKLREDILRSSQGRIRAEEENFALRGALHTQAEGEFEKTRTKAEADVARIAALGRQDVKLTDTETEAKSLRIGTLGEADAMRIRAQAEGESESLRAPGQAEAMVTLARAEGESSKERAIGDSEAIRLRGTAEAEAYRAQAQAEAEEMHAKGYTYAQETQREIGLSAMQNGLPGTGGGNGGSGAPASGDSGGAGGIGSTLGSVMGLGLELGTMATVIGATKDMIAPVLGSSVDMGKQIGGAVGGAMSQAWNCSCGKTGITSGFCPDCGARKPEPQPHPAGGWDCSCGCKNITSRFCPDCGSPRPVAPASWDCPNCGHKNITSKFCPDCGTRKDS